MKIILTAPEYKTKQAVEVEFEAIHITKGSITVHFNWMSSDGTLVYSDSLKMTGTDFQDISGLTSTRNFFQAVIQKVKTMRNIGGTIQ